MASVFNSMLRCPRTRPSPLLISNPRRRLLSYTSKLQAQAKPVLPKGNKEDGNIMAAYTAALKEKFYPSGLDTKTEAFYGAPVSLMGIPAGDNVPVEITNHSLFEIGDSLVPLSTPTFGTKIDSYADRVNRLIQSAYLSRNPDKAAEKRLFDAKRKSMKLQEQFDQLDTKVQEKYTADTAKGSMSLEQWAAKRNPMWNSLARELQGATATVNSLQAQVNGPGAPELLQKQQHCTFAHDDQEAKAPYNMPTYNLPIEITGDTTVPEGTVKTYRPTYTIDPGYKDAVEEWIAQAGSPEPAQKFKLEFQVDRAKSTSWSDFGHTEAAAKTDFSYCIFFQAEVYVNGQKEHRQISMQEMSESLRVTMGGVNAQQFSIRPGAWDIANWKAYPRFESLAEFTLPAACRVDQVILGYKVGMKIEGSGATFKKMQDWTREAVSSGGSVKFFGWDLGFGASGSGSSSHETSKESVERSITSGALTIPGVDNGYPVLLGVKGTKLEQIKVGKLH